MQTFIKQNKSRIIHIILIFYWLVLFIATTLPGKEVPDVGISDKVEHFTAYGILSILLYLTFVSQKNFPLLNKYPVLFTILICAMYGIIDELHQLLIPGRSCDIYDFFADFIGVMLGQLIITLLTQVRFLRNLFSFD